MPEVRILGPVEVVDDDGVVLEVGGPQPRRLIALLALQAGASVSADRIIEAVWPDPGQRPAEPRTSLQPYLSRLRGAGLPIDRVAEGYRFSVAVVVDADRFEQEVGEASVLADRRDHPGAIALLTDALARWRGDPPGGFGDEEWAAPSSAHLTELRIQALERRIEWRLETRDHSAALAEATSLAAEHPLRERPHRLLMLARRANGDGVGALRTYQAFRQRLLDEVGLEPSPELAEIERAIASGEAPTTEGPMRRLGSYELHEMVGEGAFGAIYRATQPSVGREVAIKVVRAELANDPDFVRRFEVEAQIVARLEHPHIVPLHDYWRDPSGAYLVMRYLRGGSAEQRLVRRGPWPLPDVARLVDEIGPALAVAHDAGVVHRDVKPANILFDETDNAYLADFGIASNVGAAATDLRSAGSPLYVSPEQVRDGETSAGSDVYAFGVVLYELLTGRPPYGDSDSVSSLLERKLQERVPAVSPERPDVPSSVDLVIQTATAPDPRQRFPSMGELVLAFRAATADRLDAATTNVDAVDGPGRTDRPREQAAQTLVSLELEAVNPYKGLAAFDEADSLDFFGRGALVNELAEHLERARFLVVAGPSGSGKSSVVRAGLLPVVRGRGQFVASIIPGEHPLEELETALLRIATGSTGALVEQLADDGRGLVRAVKTVLPDDDSELVLVVDQFEELFTLTPPERRDAFLASLAVAVTDERSRLRVICTMRADFYDRPLQHAAVSDLVRANTIAVSALSAEELDAAITGPAARMGVSIEPALVAELVSQVAGRPATLPLLQYALTETFERRIGGRMTLEAYSEIGGIAGALANRADELLDELDSAGLGDDVRRLFTRLVTPGEGTEDTRRRVLRADLAGVADLVVDSYGVGRFLTFDHDPATREPTVEVAHEALIREWPRLRRWLDDDRDGLRILRHLGQAAESWQASGRDAGELYRGGRLEAAQEWAGEHAEDLTEGERDFLVASAAQRDSELDSERRRIRRLRALLVGTGVAAVIAAAAGILALREQGRADDQRALAQAREAEAVTERIAADSAALAGDDRPLSLLLAVLAHQRDPGPRGLGALQQSLAEAGPFLGLLPLDGAVAAHWASRDRLVVAAAEGLLLVSIDGGEPIVLDGEPVQTFGHSTGDGNQRTVAVMSAAGDNVAWVAAADPTTAKVRRLDGSEIELLHHEHPVETLALIGGDSGADVGVVTLDEAGDLRRFDSAGDVIWVASAHPETGADDFDWSAGEVNVAGWPMADGRWVLREAATAVPGRKPNCSRVDRRLRRSQVGPRRWLPGGRDDPRAHARVERRNGCRPARSCDRHCGW